MVNFLLHLAQMEGIDLEKYFEVSRSSRTEHLGHLAEFKDIAAKQLEGGQ